MQLLSRARQEVLGMAIIGRKIPKSEDAPAAKVLEHRAYQSRHRGKLSPSYYSKFRGLI